MFVSHGFPHLVPPIKFCLSVSYSFSKRSMRTIVFTYLISCCVRSLLFYCIGVVFGFSCLYFLGFLSRSRFVPLAILSLCEYIYFVPVFSSYIVILLISFLLLLKHSFERVLLSVVLILLYLMPFVLIRFNFLSFDSFSMINIFYS